MMLTLAGSLFPKIGSLTVDDHGMVRLENRPLTLRIQHMENEGIPADIDRCQTYYTSEAHVLDLIRCHDNKIRFQPNSIRDEYDGRAQLATLGIMRTIHSHYLQHERRNGPFLFSLTDLHQSNIFVDDDLHIRCIIDLEWACSLPVEMIHPPWWLTGRGIDEMPEGDYFKEYDDRRREFMECFEAEEKFLYPQRQPYIADAMKTGWGNGGFWFFQALSNPRAVYGLFLDHIQPIYDKSQDLNFDSIVSRYWAPNTEEFITKKIQDKIAYDGELRRRFSSL